MAPWIIPQKDRMKEYLHGKKRFFEEALLLMKMKNLPSMVKVWEVFEENNTAYYAMEYLSGKTVKQLMAIAGGRLPWDQALDIVRKTGIALDRMHRQAGVFHRDVSPENIMVMPDGSVKIIDFGSAKMLAISENQQFSIVLKPGFAAAGAIFWKDEPGKLYGCVCTGRNVLLCGIRQKASGSTEPVDGRKISAAGAAGFKMQFKNITDS